nr:L,D-transpeptidase family protein [Sphingomonadaceae bacterium]
LTLSAPLNHGDWVWRPEAGPATGPILITADLAAETLSVFRDGHEIGVAVIHYGADSKPTPLGRFPILQKDADHKSSLYASAPMPYMLRLTADGVTIHGAQIDGRFGTHGCIGVPTPFARLLFGQVKVGDPVIVTRGRVLKVGEGVPVA